MAPKVSNITRWFEITNDDIIFFVAPVEINNNNILLSNIGSDEFIQHGKVLTREQLKHKATSVSNAPMSNQRCLMEHLSCV